MDELNSEYSKLMEIIYTYSSLNENFYDILTGKMDDGNALIILESVDKCMKIKIDRKEKRNKKWDLISYDLGTINKVYIY